MSSAVEKLQDSGHYVSCSSGTTGESAMLLASKKDMEWCKVEAVAAYSWGSGVKPAQDRCIFGVAIVGAVIAATSPTLTGVIVGRSLQGITGAVMPLCVGILRQHIDSRSLPMYIGVLTAMASVSAGLGMLFGGIIVDLLNWHWIFYSIAIVGVLAWFSVYLVLPTSSSDNRQPGTNYLGGILFAPALVFLVVGLTQGQDWDWTDGLTLSLLIAGTTLTTIIARAAPEHRTSEALEMLTVLRSVANAIGTVWVFHLLSTSTVPDPDGRGEFPTSLAYLLTMGYIAAGSFLIALLYIGFYRGREARGPVAATSQ